VVKRLSAIALLVATGYPVAAHADETAYRLDWQLDPGLNCPSEAAFQAAVIRELGRDPFGADAASSLRLELTMAEPGLLRLSLVDPEQAVVAERSLSGDGAHCAALLDGAVLALGVWLNDPTAESAEVADPVEAAEPVDEVDVNTARPAPAASSQNPAPEDGEDGARRSTEPESAALFPSGVHVAALAVGYAGILPQVSYGATLSGAYAWQRGPVVGLEVGVMSDSTTRRVIEETETELRLSLLRAAVSVEYPLHVAPGWSWTLGAVGHAGRLGVDVTGARSVGAAGYLWAAAGARTTLRVRLAARVSGLLAVDGLAPLTPRTFGVVAGPALATLAPAAGFVSLGIDVGL
jgi:hypothetical protein